MPWTPPLPSANDPLLRAMHQHWLQADEAALAPLLTLADLGASARQQAREYARRLVEQVRATQHQRGGVEALLHEYSLSSEEGVALMCLAEALLRVPDVTSMDALIRDKLQDTNWAAHRGRSHALFVNATTWALLISGKVLRYGDVERQALHGVVARMLGRLSQPVLRRAIRQAMAMIGNLFVMGCTIEQALARAEKAARPGELYSYDMLGEGARCASAAATYMHRYRQAIDAIGQRNTSGHPDQAAGISVKLSALHPRFEAAQRERVLHELVPTLKELCVQARRYNIGLTLDAEEAARLDLSLQVIQAVLREPALRGWDGFGVAVQAYQKRAPLVIDWLVAQARGAGQRIMVRLVKGAYWDTEIKRAQVQGLAGYPVFTRKLSTDVCYQACARKLLDQRAHVYPQFATHNAWTVAAILAMDQQRTGYEFQRLHGMGADLHHQVMRDSGVTCRVYAPVGEHQDLLAYLVRRLLENGANSSFVNNMADEKIPVQALIQDPLLKLRECSDVHNQAIAAPRALYTPARDNSGGFDVSDICALQRLDDAARTLPTYEHAGRAEQTVYSPADTRQRVGSFAWDSTASMQEKLARAQRAFERKDWLAPARAAFLLRLADALEAEQAQWIDLCAREAGKTLLDGLAEVREAADFCRYYAAQIQRLPPGRPHGVVLCISPWNFPLAIFIGQITAALAAGNAVLAKPAEQTSLMALHALKLMQTCGLPPDRVQCVIAPGADAGRVLIPDCRIQAVLFTGSNRTARWLFRTLAQRTDAPIPLVAETGGQNAMIADSTALAEQLVDDVIRSGFHSAGQRCSALRVLFLQADTADRVIELIKGAMDELKLGSPQELATDVGPLIDEPARQRLHEHCQRLDKDARLLHVAKSASTHSQGYFFAPRLYEIQHMKQLPEEVFGPIVHVIRYAVDELPAVVEQINAAGFGLTLGIHTRIQRRADYLAAAVKVGNVYVNRDMVGAVVGVQPFGGRGLSGTGPKAGGPLCVPNLRRRDSGADRQRYKAPDTAPVALSSPAGERNLYLIQPRGVVAAFYAAGDSVSHCLATMDAVLSTGNALHLVIPAGWRDVVLEREHVLRSELGELGAVVLHDPVQLGAAACYHTLVIPPGSALLQATMSRLLDQQCGALPRIVRDEPSASYWQRFVDEKVITTNTMAVGGDACLMSLGGG